jgi:hypothetical protein
MSDLDPNTAILTLRFPDGDVEHRSTQAELPIGSTVRTRGTHWRVREYDQRGAAILEPVETDGHGPATGDGQGAPSGPVVVPDPLGDKPLTLEVLVEA